MKSLKPKKQKIMTEVNNLKKIDSLDFRNNNRQLIISYLLRIFGVLIFGFILFIIAKNLYKTEHILFRRLIEIKLHSLPAVVSIILITLDIVIVLFFHELIHAAVYYLTHKQKPKIGIRGFVIYAAAPNKVLTKRQIIINGFAPFTVISIIGIALLTLIPSKLASWIFIPTLVNAAASGGDFMLIYWANKQPKGGKFIDFGDIINAYIIE